MKENLNVGKYHRSVNQYSDLINAVYENYLIYIHIKG